MGVPAWGSQCVRAMTRLTVVSGVLSMIGAYLVLAVEDRWALRRGRKGPVQWPILGLFHEYDDNPGATVEVFPNCDNLNDCATQLLLRDGLAFCCKMVNSEFIFTADPANVEHILKSNFANYPKGNAFHENFEIVILGDGIFNVDGEIWMKQRARRQALNFLPASCVITVLQDLFTRFTLGSTFRIAFGYEIGTLKPALPDIPFAKAFEITNEVTSSRFMNPFWKLQRALKIGSEAAVVRSAKEVVDFTYCVIKRGKSEMMSTKGFEKGDLLCSGKGDLFTRFMVLNEEGDQQFKGNNFCDTLLNFLIAGRDTTAVAFSWIVFMMMLRPHGAQKILEELRNFGDTNNAVSRVEINNRECPGGEQLNQKILRFFELLSYFDSLLKLSYLHLYPGDLAPLSCCTNGNGPDSDTLIGVDPKSVVDDLHTS